MQGRGTLLKSVPLPLHTFPSKKLYQKVKFRRNLSVAVNCNFRQISHIRDAFLKIFSSFYLNIQIYLHIAQKELKRTVIFIKNDS